MTNKEFLKRLKELTELHKDKEIGFLGIDNGNIQVTAGKFHELEKEEGLLQHISKKIGKGSKYWDYEAMTAEGVKIIAVEFVKTIEDKR